MAKTLALTQENVVRFSVASPPGCDAEMGFIQQTLPKDGDFPTSDTEGLTLNITVPASENPSTAKLPVFVFIHGGGFSIGSSVWPQYDAARLVKLSVENGLPVVAVTIKYELLSSKRTPD